MELPAIINDLLDKNQAFVSYRLPEALEPVTCIGGKFLELAETHDGPSTKGFFVAPFETSPENPYLFYQAGKTLRGWSPEYFEESMPVNPKVETQADFVFKSIDFQEYLHQADHMVKKLKSGAIQKVVLSRVIKEALPEKFHTGLFFESLCQKYPGAFVYLFNDGHGQCWAGASPEALLEVEKGKGKTMSLAGTLPAKKGGHGNFEWQNKEKEEQNLVTQFIRYKLITSGISDFVEAPLETRQAGPVVHLLKRFSYDLPDDISALGLAKVLHPTPAVCGLPAEKALKEIHAVETHKRAFYSGFLGPVSNKHEARLFVNLRCMQIVGKNAFIFVGGGLLAESDIEREWQETAIKAETLLSVIRKQIQ